MADKKKVEVKETKVEVKTATYKVFVHCGQCARDIQTEFTEFQGAFLRAVHVAALVCCFEWCMPICRRYACSADRHRSMRMIDHTAPTYTVSL